MKKCIVVQGPAQWVNEIKQFYKNSSCDVIYSIWKEDLSKYSSNDKTVVNEKPKQTGPANLFYQQKTTLSGLNYAKKNGYEYAIKMRSDMAPLQVNKFIELFQKDIHFFYWHNHNGGYIVDYFMGGKIQNMIDLWEINEKQEYKFPEEAITKSFFQKKMNQKSYHFLGDLINKENDILWLKNNIYLSTYANDKLFLKFLKNEI